jgi:hypothetical protein
MENIMETPQKQKDIILGRFNKLTEEHKSFCVTSHSWGMRMVNRLSETDNEDYDHNITYLWEHSFFGKKYSHLMGISSKALKNKQQLKNTLDIIKQQARWYSPSTHLVTPLLEQDTLDQTTLALWLSSLRVEMKNMFDSYTHDPLYNVGDIVQFRSNMGVDSIIEESGTSPHNSQTYYYGVTRSTLKRLSTKTFMVLDKNVKLEGKSYAKTYSYHEKQGGCRFYKVLPMGEAQTYLVVEKFLKQCRTKAVKDAKK